MLMRGRANRQRNTTPTPDAAVFPAEIETAVVTQEEDPAMQLTNTPTVTAEVLPPLEEAEPPTARPDPTATAVNPTEPALTATSSPPPEATPIASPTNTPTAEPTQVSCIPSPPFGWTRYSIQANDSLVSLSEAANTTVERLMQVNCLDNTLLNIGQQIWLPAIAPTATPTEIASPAPTVTAFSPGPNPTSAPPVPPSLTPPPVQPT